MLDVTDKQEILETLKDAKVKLTLYLQHPGKSAVLQRIKRLIAKLEAK